MFYDKISAKEMILVAMFTGLTAIGAAISIPVGELPISLQSLFVILAGLILGPKLGALSQIIYVTLGLIGIPIFSNFTGGPQVIIKPNFGFLIGFIFAAYIVGNISHRKKDLNNKRIWLASFTGTLVIYLFGLPYMYLILNITMTKVFSFSTIIQIGCLLFLPGDIIKAIISSIVARQISPILKKSSIYSSLK